MSSDIWCSFAPGGNIVCDLGDEYLQDLDSVRIAPWAVDGRSSTEFEKQTIETRLTHDCEVTDDNELVCGGGYGESPLGERDHQTIACSVDFDEGVSCSNHDEGWNTRVVGTVFRVSVPNSDIEGRGIMMSAGEDGGQFRIDYTDISID